MRNSVVRYLFLCGIAGTFPSTGESADSRQDQPIEEGSSRSVDAPADKSPVVLDEPLRKGISWDAQVEIGYGFYTQQKVDRRIAGRVRAGALFVHEPYYVAVGATFELGGLLSIGGGIQMELTHLWSGFWGQAGLMYGEKSRLATSLAAGWSLVGLEWQQQLTGEKGAAIFVKLHVPIGIAVFGFCH